MAGTGPTDLHALAVEFKDVCVAALDTIPTADPTLSGAPDRTFVSPGTPVADCCEQLAVVVNPLAARAAQPGAKAMINIVTLVAVATRCIPTGVGEGQTYRAPKATELEAAARQIDADGWALWNHVQNAMRDGSFLGQCDVKEFLAMQQLAPAGGCAGWQLTVQASLDGYGSS